MPRAMPQRFRVLITAGPTHEPIDAVRFIGNRSSGKLGLALCAETARRGWQTTLLLGPGTVEPAHHPHQTVLRFRTTDELQRLLRELWPQHDVLIMAAAVADFRPVASNTTGKLRRTERRLTLELEPTPDLLAALSHSTRDDQLVIGFALEPADSLIDSAMRKLASKRADAIVANPIETMESEQIEATVVLRDGSTCTPGKALAKTAFAAWLLDLIAPLAARKKEPEGSAPVRDES